MKIKIFSLIILFGCSFLPFSLSNAQSVTVCSTPGYIVSPSDPTNCVPASSVGATDLQNLSNFCSDGYAPDKNGKCVPASQVVCPGGQEWSVMLQKCSVIGQQTQTSAIPAASKCGNGIIPCDGTANCPCNFAAAVVFINNIINWFIMMAGTIATITGAIAGGKILMNPSDSKKIDEGEEMLMKTVYGLLIILGAWLVIHTVISAITNANTDALRFLGN